jgi:hypothetical protein
MTPLWWHLAVPTTAPPKRVPLFLVTGSPCPDCACPAWLASTATDGETRWFGRLFTAGADDLLCSGAPTAVAVSPRRRPR